MASQDQESASKETNTDVIGDHFTEESIEDTSLEWDCFADENYDIICHAEKVDDFYWADISGMGCNYKTDYPNGDGQNLLQDQNSSSLQTTIWKPFKQNMPRKENSAELLSATSSLTDYFSCFDSDSDDEERKERRHFDAEFSSLNLCLNISVTDKNNEPRIFITTKTEKKKPFSEGNSSWLYKETEDLLCDASESSSFLSDFDDYEFMNFSDLQSMVNEQNDKSVMRYRLVDISESDMENNLEHVRESEPKEFMPSWCQIFKPISEETENEVTKHDVRSLVESFESLIKAEEEGSKTSYPKIKKEDKAHLKVESELVKRSEKNFETNAEETVSTYIIQCEEDFTDECFHVFRKLSERIIQESFHELELESQCDLSFMNSGQVMPYCGGVKTSTSEEDQSQLINRTKYLNIEEEMVRLGQDTNDEKLKMALRATKTEDQSTTITIHAQMNCKGEEIVKSIFYTQEKIILPPEMPIQIKEKYFEQSDAHTSMDIATIEKGNIQNDTEEGVWRKQGQMVPVAGTTLQIPPQVIIGTFTPVCNALEKHNDQSNIFAENIALKSATLGKTPASVKKDTSVRYSTEQQKQEYSTHSVFKIILDQVNYTSAPVQEYIREEQEMEWNELGQIVPVEEDCLKLTQEQDDYPLLPLQQEKTSQDKQEQLGPLQNTPCGIADKENNRTLASLQKTLFESQKVDELSFRNTKGMKDGKNVHAEEDSLKTIQKQVGYPLFLQEKTNQEKLNHLDPLQNTPFRIVDKENNRTLASLQKTLFESQKGDEQSFRNTKEMRYGKIVPAKEQLQVESFPLHQTRTSQDKPEQLGPLQNNFHRIADKGYNHTLASLQKTLFETQKGDGQSFSNTKGMRNGKTTQHTTEELCGPVSKYTQKRRSRMTQEKPQETRAELLNVRNISEVLGKIEKICSGKTVHLQQEYTIQDRRYIPADRFHLATQPFAIPNPSVIPGNYESVSLNSDAYKFVKANPWLVPESNKNTKNGQGTCQEVKVGDGQRENTLKLQYESEESTIRLEYTHQDEANTGLPDEQKQDLSLTPTRIPEDQGPFPITKHSKRIIQDGRIVYIDENSWRTQSKVARLCKIFENSGSKVPRITYRMSQEANKSRAGNQKLRLTVMEEDPKQTNSTKEDKSPRRFDFDRYLQNRGENIMTRKGHDDISDESYYHVAKLLTIRIIANARIEVSREYIEQDYSKQKIARKGRLDAPPKASLPQSTCCSANMMNDKFCKRGTKEFSPRHTKQTSELTQSQWNKNNENPKNDTPLKENTVSSKICKTSKEKFQPKEYEEKDTSCQSQGRQRVWRREAEQSNGYLPNPPIDQKRKRVQFDI
ncbi:uncharacterized protein LOC133181071 [Saccostrea echinata]|uniref:uncharacterized protein LOC133181071 n=1 Tax=Saccostrea echinata TaxID=191078 RepID=UPI002A824AB7|nr:uncharacterized protein LOC133181071 [Saccostrea echinata]